MKQWFLTWLCSVGSLMLFSSTASAHHGFFGLYEMDRHEVIEVTVESTLWRNPHVVFHAVDEEGVRWDLETGPVNLLQRQGIEVDSVKVGDRILARGNPGRNGRSTMWLSNILLPDGVELMMAESEPFWKDDVVGDAVFFADSADSVEAADEKITFFRVWSNLPYSMERQVPAMNEQAQQIQAAYETPEDLDNCAPPGMPRTMFNPWPIQFADRGDHILLRVEEFDAERTIWLEPPEQTPEKSIYGFSQGRIEGNVLTIETEGMDYPQHNIAGNAEEGMPQSDQSRVTETYTLSDDGLFMYYVSSTDDPVYLNEPWVYKRTYNQKAGLEVLPWNCAN